MSKKLPRGDNQTARRVSALIRLNAQLKLKTKKPKVGTIFMFVPLTEKDIERIKNEIKTLESRV